MNNVSGAELNLTSPSMEHSNTTQHIVLVFLVTSVLFQFTVN